MIEESDHDTNIERMKTKMKSKSKARIGQEAKCMDNALVRDPATKQVWPVITVIRDADSRSTESAVYDPSTLL